MQLQLIQNILTNIIVAPLALRMRLLGFEETAGRKKRKSFSLSEPKYFDMKNIFICI